MNEILNALGGPDSIAATPTEKLVEATFESQQVHDLARNSLDFLAGLALPTVYQYAYPPIFITAWNWLIQSVSKTRAFPQLALGLPRGFGKTMVIKLFLLYCILFTGKKFLLVVCENEQKAINIVSDIMDMLNEPNIKKVFGDWRIGAETDNARIKKFGFRGRNIIIMAAGADSGIRGITLKNERPDVMVFDDIQSREAAESQLQSENLEKWMVGTAMKAKSPHGCMFLFIANMYPTKWSILRRLKQNPTWTKFIVGGILENGESLWEELQPITQLLQELKNDISMGHPEIFFAEVLNDENAAANNLLDLSKLPSLPYDRNDIPAGNFIVVDPSGTKQISDAVAIGYFEVYEGYPVLREIIEQKLSPGETIRETLKLALKHRCRLVAVEAVNYQATLNYWSKFICDQMGITGIEFVEIYPGSVHKNSRLLSMLKAYGAGEFFVDEDCKSQVHLQITQWNPLKRDNVDGILDLLSYSTRVLEMYGEYIVSLNDIQSQEYAGTKVWEFNSPF
jgi:hypothetical protein